MFERLHEPRAYARACAGLAESLYEGKGLSAASQAPEILMKGLKLIEKESESFEAASIYAILADYYALLDRYDEANVWLAKAVAVGEKTKNFAAVAQAMLNEGSFHADSGNVEEAAPIFERALALALDHGHNVIAAFCFLQLAVVTYPRNLDAARDYATRMIDHGKKVGDLPGQARGLGVLWFLEWIRGEWENAWKHLQEGMEIQDRVEFVTTSLLDGWKSWFALTRGDLDEAARYASLALAKPDPKITDVVISNLPIALLRLEQGREREAVVHLQTCAEAFRKAEFTTLPLLHVETLMHLVVLNSKGKQLDKAATNLEWAKHLATQLKSDAGLAMASQAEAALIVAKGDVRLAEEAFLKSLALWEKANWPYYRAKALVAYSEALAQTNTEESKKHLRQAAEIFKKLGAKRDLEKAETKLSAQA